MSNTMRSDANTNRIAKYLRPGGLYKSAERSVRPLQREHTELQRIRQARAPSARHTIDGSKIMTQIIAIGSRFRPCQLGVISVRIPSNDEPMTMGERMMVAAFGGGESSDTERMSMLTLRMFSSSKTIMRCAIL